MYFSTTHLPITKRKNPDSKAVKPVTLAIKLSGRKRILKSVERFEREKETNKHLHIYNVTSDTNELVLLFALSRLQFTI